MDYDELFPGRFLKAGEFQGKTVTLTITGVTIEELPQEKGEDRERGIVHFKQTKKALVLNKTNGEAIKAMFGRDVGQWIGRKVTFHPETVQLGRDKVLGIRVVGSPELDDPLTFTLKLAKKKPRQVTLTPTGTAKPPATVDHVTGEVGDDGEAEGAAGSTQRPLDGVATSEGDMFDESADD